MKKTLLLICVMALFSAGCSVITDTLLNKSQDYGAKNSQDDSASSGSYSGGSSSGHSSGSGGGIPPQMVPMMFTSFYYAYFTWGGMYYGESLKPGEWAKYEFTAKDKNEKKEKAYLVKAFLNKDKKDSWYRLKFGSEKEWMSFDFKVNESKQVIGMIYKNSGGQNGEIAISNPIELAMYQQPQSSLNFQSLPKESMKVTAGRFETYKFGYTYKGQSNGKNVGSSFQAYISPKVPGFLVKYEAEGNEDAENSVVTMELVAYGKNANKELKN